MWESKRCPIRRQVFDSWTSDWGILCLNFLTEKMPSPPHKVIKYHSTVIQSPFSIVS